MMVDLFNLNEEQFFRWLNERLNDLKKHLKTKGLFYFKRCLRKHRYVALGLNEIIDWQQITKGAPLKRLFPAEKIVITLNFEVKRL